MSNKRETIKEPEPVEAVEESTGSIRKSEFENIGIHPESGNEISGDKPLELKPREKAVVPTKPPVSPFGRKGVRRQIDAKTPETKEVNE